MARPTKPITLPEEQKQLLQAIARSREIPHSLVLRSQIVLKAVQGMTNKAVSLELGVGEDCVGLWRGRWVEGSAELEKLADNPKKLHAEIGRLLADKARVGSPGKFSAEQVCQLIALACETPPEHISHWTYKDLVRESVKRGITESISKTTVGRFLKSGGLKAASHQILAKSRN